MSRPDHDVHAAERAFYDEKARRDGEGDSLLIDEKQMREGLKYLGLLGLDPDLSGQKILECGCGPGRLTTFLALRGADVHAFDISPKSIELAEQRARANGVGARVHGHAATFENLPFEDASFDMAQGLFILHHLPDLDQALVELRRVLRPGARAFFVETNAANPILMFCRSRLTGRFGIPKLGTEDEYPLTSREFEMIEKRFPGRCEIEHPAFHFFGILDDYVFRSKIPPLSWLMRNLDRAVHLCLPFLRKYSYVVVVKLSKEET